MKVYPETGILTADCSGCKWSLAECPSGLVQIPVSMYQTVVTSLAQGNGPVQVAMAPVTTRIADTAVTMDGQAVEVVTLDQ
ncbi:nuclear respiratory factor 1-like [Neopelma chrysocephalum]|nr:nuclear respiratory factor 1-like [Neopelma chrysocephalum]